MTLVPLYQNPARDGGPLGWSSCSSTCTAMCIAFETANVKHPSGGDVRACTYNADGTRDVKGGTRPSQNVDAAKRCWNVELDYQMLDFERAWTLGQRADYALSMSISYAPISTTKFDGSPGFTGLHQVVLNGGLVYDPLADGRRPGIPSGPAKWPKDLLRRAAAKYAGPDKAAVIVARPPVSRPRLYSVIFEAGGFWVYRTDGSRTKDAFAHKTSAPCSAPFLIPSGVGKRRVVEITAGRLSGKCVEPGATHIRLVEGK